MSDFIGFLTFVFSWLLTFGYLACMTTGFAYFAWSKNVEEVNDWRCYATQDKSNTIPFTTDGPDEHDISTDFQLINNFGAVIFGIASLMFLYFTCTPRFSSSTFVAQLFGCEACIWLIFFITSQIFRFRHAGKVCSGDFLDGRWDFSKSAEAPYLLQQGVFPWYACISQYFVIASFLTGMIAIETAR